MKEVTAYMAFNGKLFETKAQCLDYEKKISRFPKVSETVKRPKGRIIDTDGVERPIDMELHTQRIQESYNSEIEIVKWFVVGGRYKFTGCYESLMNDVFKMENVYAEAGKYMDVAFAEYILYGGELDDKIVHRIVREFYKHDTRTRVMETVLEPDRKWKIEDRRWLDGLAPKVIIIIEKLEKENDTQQ